MSDEAMQCEIARQDRAVSDAVSTKLGWRFRLRTIWWRIEQFGWWIAWPFRRRSIEAQPVGSEYQPVRSPPVLFERPDGSLARYVEQLPDDYVAGTERELTRGFSTDRYTLEAPRRDLDPGAQLAAQALAVRTRRPVLTVDGWVVPESLGASARLFHAGDADAEAGAIPVPRMVLDDIATRDSFAPGLVLLPEPMPKPRKRRSRKAATKRKSRETLGW